MCGRRLPIPELIIRPTAVHWPLPLLLVIRMPNPGSGLMIRAGLLSPSREDRSVPKTFPSDDPETVQGISRPDQIRSSSVRLIGCRSLAGHLVEIIGHTTVTEWKRSVTSDDETGSDLAGQWCLAESLTSTHASTNPLLTVKGHECRPDGMTLVFIATPANTPAKDG